MWLLLEWSRTIHLIMATKEDQYEPEEFLSAPEQQRTPHGNDFIIC
jgi:hypothetical protein